MLKKLRLGQTKVAHPPDENHEPKTETEKKADYQDVPIGVVIPPQLLEARMEELKRKETYEALKAKVEQMEAEARLREQLLAIAAKHPPGILRDRGRNDDLGRLNFKLLYDVHRESLKVTLVEACNLSPLDNREPTINARCNVQLKSSKDPDVIIDPRPKYRLIPGTEGNAGGHGGGSNLPGEFKHAKTETVGAASSTVIWSTHHPVWNETFYFDEISNSRLKTYVLTFTMHDHQKSLSATRKPEVRLGEVRFPLMRIYKRIAAPKKTQAPGKQDDNTVTGNGGGEEPTTQKADDTYENVPVVELPTEKRVISQEYLEEWVTTGQMALGEEGATPDEMEELESICNSEAVREELMDPDLMDSVSVREQQIAATSLKMQFARIKELVKMEPEEAPPSESDESEEAVPEAERPYLIRRIEGWQYINRIPGERFLYGEMEIGLMYSPERMKFTIEICKGIDIANEQGDTLTIWAVLQKKRRIYKKFQPNVSDLANQFGVSGTIKEKQSKARFTTVRQGTHNPVWDEKFEYELSPNDMSSVYVDVEIHEQSRKLCAFRFCRNTAYRASRHWKAMMERPNSFIFMNYKIQ
uniref:C2 domain-containing protein n=1 Tax=Schistocephalus solidus TaxID=70667 RepID=A0A0X3NIC7_SCHSO